MPVRESLPPVMHWAAEIDKPRTREARRFPSSPLSILRLLGLFCAMPRSDIAVGELSHYNKCRCRDTRAFTCDHRYIPRPDFRKLVTSASLELFSLFGVSPPPLPLTITSTIFGSQ
jgi:hypothetical protein